MELPSGGGGISLTFGTLKRCDGSCTAIINGTEAVAGCVGPLESRFSNLRLDGQLEISLKNEAITDSQEEANLAVVIRDSLMPCLKLMQRSITSLSVRVLADEGQGFAAAFLACVGALLSAGVPMLQLPVAVECHLDENNVVNVHPGFESTSNYRARFLLVFTESDKEPLTLIMNGQCKPELIRRAVDLAREQSIVARLHLVHELKSHLDADRDLCF